MWVKNCLHMSSQEEQSDTDIKYKIILSTHRVSLFQCNIGSKIIKTESVTSVIKFNLSNVIVTKRILVITVLLSYYRKCNTFSNERK